MRDIMRCGSGLTVVLGSVTCFEPLYPDVSTCPDALTELMAELCGRCRGDASCGVTMLSDRFSPDYVRMFEYFAGFRTASLEGSRVVHPCH